MKELKGNYQTNLEVYIYNFQKNRIDEFVNAFNLQKLKYNSLNIKQIMCLSFSLLAQLLHSSLQCNEQIFEEKLPKLLYFVKKIKSIFQGKKELTINLINNQLKYYTKPNHLYKILCEFNNSLEYLKQLDEYTKVFTKIEHDNKQILNILSNMLNNN